MSSFSGSERRTFLKGFIMLIIMGVTVCSTFNLLFAHEPLFGFGPHTIYLGGLGVEIEFEREGASSSKEKERDLILHQEIIYGLTEDLALTLALPFILNRKLDANGIGTSSSGIGDTSLRVKYRFWRRDRLGVQDSAAFIVSIKFPSGNTDKSPRLGTGSTDFLFGAAAARESLLWYYFADVRYRVNTRGNANLKIGDRFFADGAIGIRLWPAEYLKPDLVVLAELNWETFLRDKLDGLGVKESGGNLLFISPSFFFTYRNWAVKGGVQIPLYQSFDGNQPEEGLRFKMAVEVHF